MGEASREPWTDFASDHGIDRGMPHPREDSRAAEGTENARTCLELRTATITIHTRGEVEDLIRIKGK